jgi:hypothetical protein
VTRVRALQSSPHAETVDDAAFGRALELVEARDMLVLDDLPPVQALAWLDAVHAVSLGLLRRVETRTPARLRRARVVRLLSLGLTVLALLGAGVFALTRPRNLALHMPASTSSYWRGSPPAAALVNGQIESPWGSAARGPEAWFAVDLEGPHAIERVVVVNRSDGYARETPPFVLEFSEDGRHFREQARFTAQAAGGERWVFETGRQTSRYVRVRKLDARGFALSEIEVYGSPR